MDHEQIITLVDEDGKEHEFELVDVIEVDGKRYALLTVANGDDRVYIFAIEKLNGEEVLRAVDDDEEFEKVSAAIDELMEDDSDDF